MVATSRCLSSLALLVGAASGLRKTRVHAQGDEIDPATMDRRAPPPFMEGALTNQNLVEEHQILNTRRTTWEGWGVAMAWWANVFGNDQDVADLVWTLGENISVGPKPELQGLPGLGLTVARYNVGGSVGAERDGRDSPPGRIEWPEGNLTMDYSNIKDYKRIQGFWLDWFDRDPDSASWNWKTDERQINAMKMAQDRGANLFELFSNSPMWWMTKSKNPAGTKEVGGENLQEWNIPDLAYYIGQVAKRFKEQHNIKFHSISPYNEPSGNRWSNCFWHSGDNNNGQEGNCMYQEQQAKVIKAMHEELQRIGLDDVMISAAEENTFDQAKDTWNELDPEAMNLVQQVNVHGYSTIIGDRVHLGERAAREGKVLWMSEFGDSDQWPVTGTKANGMLLANCIHYDFEYLGMSSWSYWQILDETWGWGMIKFANSAEEGWWGENKQHWYLEPKFWVMAHFTRHIRPGMYILDHSSFLLHGAYTIAAYCPNEKKLVLVTTNFGYDRWVNYDLSSLSKVAGSGFSWVTDSDGPRKYQKEEGSGDWTVPADKRFGSQFAPYSVKSFEIHDVEL